MGRLTGDETRALCGLVEGALRDGAPRATLMVWFLEDAPAALGRLPHEPPDALARSVVALCDAEGWAQRPAWMLVLLDQFRGQPAADAIRARLDPDARKVRILFLASNPTDMARLKLGDEYVKIREHVRRSQWRDHLQLDYVPVGVASGLGETLREHRPDLVHFGGHASEGGELTLPDASGNALAARPEHVAELFRLLSRDLHIRCVVLNACYSDPLASALTATVDCVIGMPSELEDTVAIVFAGEFYSALGDGRDVDTAFGFARNAISLENPSLTELPRVHYRVGVRGQEIKLVDPRR